MSVYGIDSVYELYTEMYFLWTFPCEFKGLNGTHAAKKNWYKFV